MCYTTQREYDSDYTIRASDYKIFWFDCPQSRDAGLFSELDAIQYSLRDLHVWMFLCCVASVADVSCMSEETLGWSRDVPKFCGVFLSS